MIPAVDGPIGRWLASPPMVRGWPPALAPPTAAERPIYRASPSPADPAVASTVQGAPADWCTIFWWLC